MNDYPQSTCDLSILIISWNVWELLRSCLHSIEAISQPDSTPDSSLRRFGPAQQTSTLEVIVVDNASSDVTCEQLSIHFPWVRLIRSESNLGFTKGNNLGYRHSRGHFIYFLNPDTEIIPPDASDAQVDSLWLLYSAVRNDSRVGMAGPQLRYGDGSWQNSRRRFPTPLTGFFESTWLGQAWRNNPWSTAMHMQDIPSDAPHDVDWITGAAMLARREALEEAGEEGGKGEREIATRNSQPSTRNSQFAIRNSQLTTHNSLPFDEGFFMYSEELDLCKRVKDAGWRILYVPASRLIHYEGKSSEQVVAARHIRFNTSKVRYWRKWFGPGWASALRAYLLLEYRWQWLNEWVKATLGHKPEMRRARMAAYQEVLRSGLRSTDQP